MANVLDVILNTINDVQRKNKQNPNVDTAHPSVFDLLRDKIQDLNTKQQQNQINKGRRNPKSILDLLKDGIEGARKENRNNPNIQTADKSIFDEILGKVNKVPQRQATSGIKKIIQDYNLDVSRIPKNMLVEIQNKYQSDLKNMNQQYAQSIFSLTKKMR